MQEEKAYKKELKKLDLNAKTFEANGKKYHIESGLSLERYIMYQKMQIEVGYEVGFYGLFEKVKKIYDLCNQMKFADIAVLSRNILDGITKVDDRKIPGLTLAALFINEENENRLIINNDMVDQKIADWEAEGYDMLPFLQLAISSIPNFSIAYKAASQIISGINEAEKSLNT